MRLMLKSDVTDKTGVFTCFCNQVIVLSKYWSPFSNFTK